jgi:hypothetical protein
MDTQAIRSDDFAGLLAALSKSVNPSFSADVGAANVWPQQTAQQQMLQNASAIVSSGAAAQNVVATAPKASKTMTYVIVGVIVFVIFVFAVLAWMRGSKMKEDESEEEEDSNEVYARKARKEPKEIPPPSSALAKKRLPKHVEFAVEEEEVKPKEKNKAKQEFEEEEEEFDSEFEEKDEVSAYVSKNLRLFAKQQRNIIDISGMELPTEFIPPPAVAPTAAVPQRFGRIVADESQEVLDYAKKREALFKDE